MGGFFLMKKPLECVLLVYTNSETAIAKWIGENFGLRGWAFARLTGILVVNGTQKRRSQIGSVTDDEKLRWRFNF